MRRSGVIGRKRRVLARGAAGAAALAAGLAGQAGGLGVESRAQAPAATATAAPATTPGLVPVRTCAVQGTAPGPKGTAIYDAPSGGRVIATFTGAVLPLRIGDLPADPSTGRASVATSTGTGALRVEGWAAASAFTVYTARDLSVHGPYVWMASAQKVKLVQAAAGQMTAELALLGTSGQTVRAQATCDAFSLERGAPTSMEVPANGRAYRMKGTTLELYDHPSGDVVFTLRMDEGTSQLFWSTESRAGFVHLKQRSEVILDAWAKLKDVEPLKKGEMMDQFAAGSTAVQGAALALDKPPRLVQASRAIPLRARRDEKEKPIGAIEPGAEVYVMEVVAGWANVLPRHLGVTPPDDGGFWIPSSEVPP